MSSPLNALDAVDLEKWFGEGETKTVAVKKVTFSAHFGEILFIIGPSGSGKTTLLSMISGILRPNSGTVSIGGKNVWEMNENDLADLRLNKIGFVFQDYHLFPRLTTAENVAIPLILKKQDWNHSIEEARKRLDKVGLKNKADVAPVKLSGGEQQRVGIARAIVSDPEILIFDEPTASLDGETGKNIVNFIKKEILTDKKSIIIVTHDDRIYEFADRIIKMEDGHLTETKLGEFK